MRKSWGIKMKDSTHEVFENLPRKFSVILLLTYEDVEPLRVKFENISKSLITRVQEKTEF